MTQPNFNPTSPSAIHSNFTQNSNPDLPHFIPPFWLKNAHLQTILPKFFAPKLPNYHRILGKDSLNESDIAYDFYWQKNTDPALKNRIKSLLTQASGADCDRQDLPKDQIKTPLVVLFHGMEGSSESHYARALAHAVHQRGWHFVVVHFRSCGGVPVRGSVFYNAGDTVEIDHALKPLAAVFGQIGAVGVSLGGNALAKYLGEFGAAAVCRSAVIVSAPVDLASASVAMARFLGRRIYTPYLLNPIVKKALDNRLSDDEKRAIEQCKTISDFDEIFTAPRHGFRSKNDYYRQASALPFLIQIECPTLMISATDDPFLGVVAMPNDVSESVRLLYPRHGGHIGFLRYQAGEFDLSWLPQTVLAFLEQNLECEKDFKNVDGC